MKSDQSSDIKRKSERRQSRRQAPIQKQTTKAGADLANAGQDQRHHSERDRAQAEPVSAPQRNGPMKPVRAVPLARAAPACTRTDLISGWRDKRRMILPPSKSRSRPPTDEQLSSKNRRSRKTLESRNTANSRNVRGASRRGFATLLCSAQRNGRWSKFLPWSRFRYRTAQPE